MKAGPWVQLRLNNGPHSTRVVWRRYREDNAGAVVAVVVRNGKPRALWCWNVGRDESFRVGHRSTEAEAKAAADDALVAQGWEVAA
jgi:hypothetical protein